jgi:hypothetical protein
MTKPARGVFRAISSFARYVTPSALGSLSINSSALSSPDGTYDLTTETPGVVEGNAPILDDPVTSTPPFLTPAGSTTDLRASQEVTTSPPTLSQNGPPNASSARPLSWRPRFDLGSRQNSASTSKQSLAAEASGSARPMLLQYPTTAPSGDDAGGRFREDHDRNSLALPGTAGHPGIYRGPNVCGPGCCWTRLTKVALQRLHDSRTRCY